MVQIVFFALVLIAGVLWLVFIFCRGIFRLLSLAIAAYAQRPKVVRPPRDPKPPEPVRSAARAAPAAPAAPEIQPRWTSQRRAEEARDFAEWQARFDAQPSPVQFDWRAAFDDLPPVVKEPPVFDNAAVFDRLREKLQNL